MPFKQFQRDYLLHNKYVTPFIKEIKHYYNSADSYCAFFNILNDAYDCVIFAKWLKKFIDTQVQLMLLWEVMWKIKKSTIVSWNIQVISQVVDKAPFMEGGFTFIKTPRTPALERLMCD